LRGAYNLIANLPEELRRKGVITYSSGNHAQGVAYSARALGVKAIIVMPGDAPRVKIEATRALGAEIVLVGPAGSERQAKAEELSARHGYAIVPPFDHEAIIAGAGTTGLEIMEDLPQVELVLVPVGGGGLLSGVAAAIKQSKPNIKVVGVEPELANDAQRSFRGRELATFPAEATARTIADGLRTQSVGSLNFGHLLAFVDDIITVSEDEILQAIREIALRGRLVAEPSGAVTTAAFLFHREDLPRARQTVAVVSGGNIEPVLLEKCLVGS
jgi:threonine dehydratase